METAWKDKTPSERFEQFYSSEVCDHIVKETGLYSADVKIEHGFLITADEIHVSIEIILLTGYLSNTCERDY
ncbi:hypothetical protein TNCV_2589551 [Trichonephila clavipes]|nr:hypothetical protein TNCV_2589551 [Trichonephila clavipes]